MKGFEFFLDSDFPRDNYSLFNSILINYRYNGWTSKLGHIFL